MMKQIKFYLTITLLLTAFLANAQIKVHNDNHISIGSLTKQYGIQVYPNAQIQFETSVNADWGWITLSQTTNSLSKCWIVRNLNIPAIQPFFVTGGGTVYRVGEVTVSDSRLQQRDGNIENPSDVLNQIEAFYYNFTDDMKVTGNRDSKRRIGFSAQEIEKVLPEAVETDENGIMYMNYEVLTAFLVEAVIEQQQEIENLRSILKENGLLK